MDELKSDIFEFNFQSLNKLSFRWKIFILQILGQDVKLYSMVWILSFQSKRRCNLSASQSLLTICLCSPHLRIHCFSSIYNTKPRICYQYDFINWYWRRNDKMNQTRDGIMRKIIIWHFFHLILFHSIFSLPTLSCPFYKFTHLYWNQFCNKKVKKRKKDWKLLLTITILGMTTLPFSQYNKLIIKDKEKFPFEIEEEEIHFLIKFSAK